MRILLFSNAPHAPTGYGQQTAIWSQKLPELGHDVAVAAFSGLQGAPLRHDGVTVFPGSLEHQYAQDVLPGHYKMAGADVLITLMDAWVLEPAPLAGMNIAHWMPVDCAPLSHLDRRVLDMAGGQPIAMSRHGERMLTEAGHEPLFVPHGILTQVFRPAPDRDELRQGLGFDDRFVVGICAANQDPLRKGFPEMFAAFAQFRRKHPEALLLVHSRTDNKIGVNLKLLAGELGISDAVKYGDQYMIASGLVQPGDMANWYSCLDVLMNCSYGEGFGLPVVEAQACGTPVIVTDFSAMSELCGAGWKVAVDPLDDMFWNRGHSCWWARPKPRRILTCLEKAHAGAGKLREKAREFALGYDADRVLHEHWEPVLKSLEEAL